MQAVRAVLCAAALAASLLLLSRLGGHVTETLSAAAQSGRVVRHYPSHIHAPAARCAWESASPSMPPERNTSAAVALGAFLAFLDQHVHRSLGYLYSLRDGNLLGAVRHHGLSKRTTHAAERTLPTPHLKPHLLFTLCASQFPATAIWMRCSYCLWMRVSTMFATRSLRE